MIGFDQAMEKMYESLARHDRLGLGLAAFAAMSVLAAILWHMAPGLVMLVLAPALGVGLVRLAVSPVYGLRMGAQRLMVMADDGDTIIPYEQVAHLSVTDRGEATRVTLVLRDGREMDVPLATLSNQLDLIRAATDRGIPVRTS